MCFFLFDDIDSFHHSSLAHIFSPYDLALASDFNS